jgi:hypothetical protein
MASNTMHRQSLARRRSNADNRLRGPSETTPPTSLNGLGDLPACSVHDIDASNGTVADPRIEARVTAVLSGVEHIKSRASNVYFSVASGVVTLYGAVHDSDAAREIEQAVRANAGIDAVQNYIFTIGARCGD